MELPAVLLVICVFPVPKIAFLILLADFFAFLHRDFRLGGVTRLLFSSSFILGGSPNSFLSISSL